MRTSALFGEKTLNFKEFMVCPHRQGGLSQCRQGGRDQFFVWTSFKDGPLALVVVADYGGLNVHVQRRSHGGKGLEPSFVANVTPYLVTFIRVLKKIVLHLIRVTDFKPF